MINSDQISAKFATLSNDQLSQFIENYAERIVDGMDMKCLEQFAYDTIITSFDNKSANDILEEISHVVYDSEIEEMLENVTD